VLQVAVLWGTYTPAIRFLFTSPSPPTAALMNALQACLSAAVLSAAGLVAVLAPGGGGGAASPPLSTNPLSAEAAALASFASSPGRRRGAGSAGGSSSAGGGGVGGSGAGVGGICEGSSRARPCDAGVLSRLRSMLPDVHQWLSGSLAAAGFELGVWQVMAFGLEMAGLEVISASKAAFLNQATVLITPLLVHMSGDFVHRSEWAACVLGLLGATLVAVDSAHGAVGAREGSAAPAGYICIVVSAVFYAMSTVRMGYYSSQLPALALSINAAVFVSLFSLLWVMYDLNGSAEGWAKTLRVLRSLFTSSTCVAVLAWIGVGPGALAQFLQAAGQRAVPAAQAQLIYATTPLYATGIAMMTLDAKTEAMGLVAWAGAGLLLGAALLASVGSSSEDSSNAQHDAKEMPETELAHA